MKQKQTDWDSTFAHLSKRSQSVLLEQKACSQDKSALAEHVSMSTCQQQAPEMKSQSHGELSLLT